MRKPIYCRWFIRCFKMWTCTTHCLKCNSTKWTLLAKTLPYEHATEDKLDSKLYLPTSSSSAVGFIPLIVTPVANNILQWQFGQVLLCINHSSTHSLWNLCLKKEKVACSAYYNSCYQLDGNMWLCHITIVWFVIKATAPTVVNSINSLLLSSKKQKSRQLQE